MKKAKVRFHDRLGGKLTKILVVEQFCTFPVIEKSKLFAHTIFNFLVCNEYMHLKNFSLITDQDIVCLAPIYDFVNSSIVLKDPEEIALKLNGKKRNLTRRMLVQYFGIERLALESRVVSDHLERFAHDLKQWFALIELSFLSAELQFKYKEVVTSRAQVLDLL